MTRLVYYHNPKCSKSRKGLELLEGYQFDLRHYLKDLLTESELLQLFKQLDLSPSEVFRKKEAKDLGLQDLSDSEWIMAISKHPILLERPILSDGIKAIIARPPERILNFLK